MTGEITNCDRRTITEELELIGQWNARSEECLRRVEAERREMTHHARIVRGGKGESVNWDI